VILLAVLVLLFPDGRLPSPRWRPVLWALAVVAAGLVGQQFQAGTKITGGITNALDRAGVAYPNPLGVLPRNGWFSGLLAGVFFLALVTVLLVLASVFVRRRGASPERRQQLAWLGYVGVRRPCSARCGQGSSTRWTAVLTAPVMMPNGC
jgi:hypothetical protein